MYFNAFQPNLTVLVFVWNSRTIKPCEFELSRRSYEKIIIIKYNDNLNAYDLQPVVYI